MTITSRAAAILTIAIVGPLLALVGATPSAQAHAGRSTTSAATGTVKGSVHALDGTPVEHAVVRGYSRDDTGTWVARVGTETRPDGTYRLNGVPSGVVRLGVTGEDAGYTDVFYRHAADVDHATDVTVGSGTTVKVDDVTLTPLGTISGRVLAPASHTAYDTFVTVQQREARAHGGALWVDAPGATSQTDHDGTFSSPSPPAPTGSWPTTVPAARGACRPTGPTPPR